VRHRRERRCRGGAEAEVGHIRAWRRERLRPPSSLLGHPREYSSTLASVRPPLSWGTTMSTLVPLLPSALPARHRRVEPIRPAAACPSGHNTHGRVRVHVHVRASLRLCVRCALRAACCGSALRCGCALCVADRRRICAPRIASHRMAHGAGARSHRRRGRCGCRRVRTQACAVPIALSERARAHLPCDRTYARASLARAHARVRWLAHVRTRREQRCARE
jgi:hypothetical protein